MHIGIWLRRAKPACACSRGPVAQAGSRAPVAAAVMCGAWHPSCSPPRCSTSGGHEWWPRLLQGEQEIDIEACEAGEAANLFSGAAHRLRLQKVLAAGLQPRVKKAATLCIQTAALFSPGRAVTIPMQPLSTPQHPVPLYRPSQPLTAPNVPSRLFSHPLTASHPPLTAPYLACRSSCRRGGATRPSRKRRQSARGAARQKWPGSM